MVEKGCIRLCIYNNAKFLLVCCQLSFECGKCVCESRSNLTTNSLGLTSTTTEYSWSAVLAYRMCHLFYLALVVYVFFSRHIYVIVTKRYKLTFHSID